MLLKNANIFRIKSTFIHTRLSNQAACHLIDGNLPCLVQKLRGLYFPCSYTPLKYF